MKIKDQINIKIIELCNKTQLLLINQNSQYKNNLTKKLIIYILFLIYLIHFFLKYYLPINKMNRRNLNPYKNFINDCKKHKRYNRIKIKNIYPYISVCIPSLNMEKYIEQTILSIINQSFQDFEIIIVNDKSKDNTEVILHKLHLEDDRIKIINHAINKGVYYSRVEAILNSIGKYIILMDPDDMFLNENLFQELYYYNLNKNLDIIEFIVYHQIEGRRNIIYPNNHFETHYHNFSKKIIYQPELSKILFKLPDKELYSHSICRNIWNKMIKKKIFLDMHKFIGLDYFNKFIITADDMVMNLIIYHFAQNYTNIDLPGYMYNLRSVSMSRGNGGVELKTIRTINHLFYFQIFYNYIKQFNLNRKSLYYEIKNLKRFFYYIKDYNIVSYEKNAKNFLNDIINDKYTNKRIKTFISELIFYLEEEQEINLFEWIKKIFKLKNK